jgi:hypothetical protein
MIVAVASCVPLGRNPADAHRAPEAMGQLRANFERFPGGGQILDQMPVALRSSLALDRTSTIGMFILLGGSVVALFLGERPLRKSNLPEVFAEHGGSFGGEALASASDTAGAAAGTEEAREAEQDRTRAPVPVGD